MNDNENEALKLASRFINHTAECIFLTGKAGTGKTTFLHSIVKSTHKRAVVTAPTGVAAINAGGVTLHSLFQLPFGSFIPQNGWLKEPHPYLKINDPQSLIRESQMREQKRSLLRNIELLIIDEVSMLRADILDAVDAMLKYVRRNPRLPFGGVQVLFIGDLLQLPPVVKDDEFEILKHFYDNLWFFNAKVLQNNTPIYIELETVYRQSDQSFISLLNNLRNNTLTATDIELLKSRYKPAFTPPENENYITLTTHNAIADELNRNQLAKLKEKTYVYDALIKGDFGEYMYPVELKLALKLGAQVMFIKNDPSGMRSYYNGLIGFVSQLTEDEIHVGFTDGSPEVKLEYYEWQNKRYFLNQESEIEEEIMGTFLQYPIKLAWAVTVHKSQGLTFDKAIVDIGQAFAPGQVYVALSRLRSLDGLVLKSGISSARLFPDPAVLSYSKNKAELDVLDKKAEIQSLAYLKAYLSECYDFDKNLNALKRHIDSYTKDEVKSAKQKYLHRALNLYDEFHALKLVADKFTGQLDRILSHPKERMQEVLLQRINAANEYFLPAIRKLREALFALFREVKQNEMLVKVFLQEILALETLLFELSRQLRKAPLLAQIIACEIEIPADMLEQCKRDSWRDEQLSELSVVRYTPRKKTPQSKQEKKAKQPKGASRKRTLEMFNAGKSVEEIAVERNLAPTTIEGHLEFFVRHGELSATAIMGEEKLGILLDAIRLSNAAHPSDIRPILSDDFSWADIRIAFAHRNREESQAAVEPF